jgi:hypothetical protein
VQAIECGDERALLAEHGGSLFIDCLIALLRGGLQSG